MVKKGGTAAGGEYFTRFEKARILGARALQISLGAPILVDAPPEVLDPLVIAEMEFDALVIPITVIHRKLGTIIAA
ncbi:MAG: DNA-directed RNA polymerase subunit K [Candidatus Thermoplasmatota archaeon]|jgi:DNA-directed RNA polymerase subunit K|nr:DNA-directed RNA polymerase subunit K [Candidatus Thermoplasmatota archaeon]MCL5984367.1 DNA-directed RNA polymerase subunit K [Candidatus Thermoplasmatota archaeon]